MGLINKGNTIHVSASSIQDQRVTIKWSQSLKSRSEDYYVASYNVPGSDAQGAIFVQASKLDEFKNKNKGDSITVDVDGSFQYGQDKAQTRRFLVYHDKNNKQYQHRYVENTLTSLGDKAKDLAGVLGFPQVGSIETQLSNFVGDYLKDF
ncbi:uncharacterized protein M421DRAFT_89316 [Didymella exigua CBS 183.55]|uniref:Uncharacterized protein n=1 Tax=Didymella exigua CBS 183.55 TaxID=1150837 RepID=A0A6A5S0B0_9PLEO|nr:uncharacterized protein M421DRAFT_89316 [Didymella exigua CBS 183.55]KAF1933020.1 hypothetical protein M421DRAFT_89316 [Didymella exigua CBS 183.55]